jgi:hypothetical protein
MPTTKVAAASSCGTQRLADPVFGKAIEATMSWVPHLEAAFASYRAAYAFKQAFRTGRDVALRSRGAATVCPIRTARTRSLPL